MVSATSAPAQGTEWRHAAEGAQLAASRFARGGTTITLVPVNDKGTADGAIAAIQPLADKKVAGIVLATSGSHTRDALQEAAERDLPVLLPYATPAGTCDRRGWLTGAEDTVTDQRMVELLRHEKLPVRS